MVGLFAPVLVEMRWTLEGGYMSAPVSIARTQKSRMNNEMTNNEDLDEDNFDDASLLTMNDEHGLASLTRTLFVY